MELRKKTITTIGLTVGMIMPLGLTAAQSNQYKSQSHQGSSIKGDAKQINESQLDDLRTASEILGKDVENSQGDSIGEIDSLVINRSNGKIKAAVITVDSFMGVGGDLVKVPYDELNIQKGSDNMETAVVWDVSRDDLSDSLKSSSMPKKSSDEMSYSKDDTKQIKSSTTEYDDHQVDSDYFVATSSNADRNYSDAQEEGTWYNEADGSEGVSEQRLRAARSNYRYTHGTYNSPQIDIGGFADNFDSDRDDVDLLSSPDEKPHTSDAQLKSRYEVISLSEETARNSKDEEVRSWADESADRSESDAYASSNWNRTDKNNNTDRDWDSSDEMAANKAEADNLKYAVLKKAVKQSDIKKQSLAHEAANIEMNIKQNKVVLSGDITTQQNAEELVDIVENNTEKEVVNELTVNGERYSALR